MKKSLAHSTYHSVLRIAVLVFAIVLIFDSGLLLKNTKIISTSTQQYLANAVGVYVGVAPTELNQLTARITELEGELDAKERLIAVNINNDENGSIDKSTLILSIIVFILLVLIILNYILDYLRMRKIKPLQNQNT